MIEQLNMTTMEKNEQEIKIVTLRPDPLDSEAIVAIKEHYSTKEATTAILAAVRDVRLQQKEVDRLEHEQSQLQAKYDNLAHSVETFMSHRSKINGIQDIWHKLFMFEDCEECDGSGKVLIDQGFGEEDCKDCNGTGKVDESK